MPATIPQRPTQGKRDRLGRISISRQWTVDTLAEVFTVGEPTVLNLPEEDRSFERLDDGPGRYRVTITYAGCQGDSPDSKDTWNGKLSMREEPIESAPNFQALFKTYQGSFDENGKVTWPEKLSSKTGGLGSKSTQTKKNPMFGASTYPVLQGELERTYTRVRLPPNLLTSVGKVLKKLPGSSGLSTPPGYVWIVLCPDWSNNHGSAWSITERYLLTPGEGYQSIVYGTIQR